MMEEIRKEGYIMPDATCEVFKILIGGRLNSENTPCNVLAISGSAINEMYQHLIKTNE